MSNTSFTGKVSGRMSSRGWAIALGIGAVVLAAILLVVYLDRYRSRVAGENAPTPVLVAKQLIPAGTPGTLVASNSMYAPTTLPQKEVEVGAISDPAYLSGRAAAVDIFPGQQFTATDFAASDTASVDSQLTGTQRAFAMSIDGVHGVSSQVMPGDHGRRLHVRRRRGEALPPERQGDDDPDGSQARPAAATSSCEIDTKEAATWLYAADNTSLIFVLRPVVGAKPTKPSQATAATLLR